jgi:ABC-2 type transport system ATP-binding protein
MTAVVEISKLRKTYGRTVAVDEVSFQVAEGEIFGVLGPNGAGKTTTVECVGGLRRADAGSIRVLGLDPGERRGPDAANLRESIGMQLQNSAVPAKLTVREVLDMYASFYRDPADPAALIKALGLESKRDTYFKRLSGGQRQRVSIALALVGNPRLAVLDELTTGLDPQARRETWALIEAVRDRGVTVILVSHFMEEAEYLCDRVVLIDAGRVVAQGTCDAVVSQAGGGNQVRFRPSAEFDDALLTALPGVRTVERHGGAVTVTGEGDLVNAVIQALSRVDVTARDLRSQAATLEDAFIALTGRVAADSAAAD